MPSPIATTYAAKVEFEDVNRCPHCTCWSRILTTFLTLTQRQGCTLNIAREREDTDVQNWRVLQIAQVSGQLLRYYDKIGLFKPVRIDAESGYRYYSAKQLPELNRILALKELGLALDEITRLSPYISPDEMRGMLVRKKAQIEQTLREELVRMRSIESRIDQIEREGHLLDYEVVLKSVAAQPFLATREPATTLAACRAAAQDIGRFVPAHVSKKTWGTSSWSSTPNSGRPTTWT